MYVGSAVRGTWVKNTHGLLNGWLWTLLNFPKHQFCLSWSWNLKSVLGTNWNNIMQVLYKLCGTYYALRRAGVFTLFSFSWNWFPSLGRLLILSVIEQSHYWFQWNSKDFYILSHLALWHIFGTFIFISKRSTRVSGVLYIRYIYTADKW